jgi:hypothetical protein
MSACRSWVTMVGSDAADENSFTPPILTPNAFHVYVLSRVSTRFSTKSPDWMFPDRCRPRTAVTSPINSSPPTALGMWEC